jgi:hypothetical protein
MDDFLLAQMWLAAQPARPFLGAIEQILGPKTGTANSVPALIDFYIAAKLLNYFPFF